MSENSKKPTKRSAPLVKQPVSSKQARSIAIASKGIATTSDFARLMSALMSDLIEGKVPPSIGNATCNAGGKMLKAVEMTFKYGTPAPSGPKTLALTAVVGE